MFTYNLSVRMANRSFSFKESPEILDIIKEAITGSNASFSASRYKRTIELQKDLIDDKHIHLIMKSRDEINPTRSLSSLSIAFYKIAKEKDPSLIEKCTYNGSVFNAKVIEAPKQPITIEELSDSELLKSVIDLMYSKKYEEQKTKLKEFMLPIINDN